MWLSLRLDCIRTDWAVWHFPGIKSETADGDFSFSCQVNQMWSSVYDCSQLSDDACSLYLDGVFAVLAGAQTWSLAVIHIYTVNKHGLRVCGGLWWNAVDFSSFLESELLWKRKVISKCLPRFLYFCSFEPNFCGLKFSSRVPVLAVRYLLSSPDSHIPVRAVLGTGEVFHF